MNSLVNNQVETTMDMDMGNDGCEFALAVAQKMTTLDNITETNTPIGSFEANAPVDIYSIMTDEDIIMTHDIPHGMSGLNEGIQFTSWKSMPVQEERASMIDLEGLELKETLVDNSMYGFDMDMDFSDMVEDPIPESIMEPVAEPIVEPVAEPIVEPVVDYLAAAMAAAGEAAAMAAAASLPVANGFQLEYPVVNSSSYIESPTTQAEITFNLLLGISEASTSLPKRDILMRFFNGNVGAVNYLMMQVERYDMAATLPNEAGGETVTITRRSLTKLFKHTRSMLISSEVVVDGVVVTPAVHEGLECLTQIFMSLPSSTTHVENVDNNQCRKFFTTLQNKWEAKKLEYVSKFEYVGGHPSAFKFNW